MRKYGVTAVMVLAVTTLGACESECNGLKATAQDREAVANGYEVEREGSMGGTCELTRDGTWQVDD